MPTRPPLHRPAGMRTKRERDKAFDAKRTAEQPWRRWYWSPRWRAIAKAQLAEHPLCIMCERTKGVRTAATHCDHVVPHRGNPALFWEGERQSLCTTCHNREKQREEAGAR